ncbi:MAG: PH domain-containing protein [Actinomycetota bacterium]
MAFPKDLLAEHETVVFDLKPHFVALLPSIFWTIVAVALIVVGYVFTEAPFAYIIAGAAVVGWLILAVPPFLRWQFTLFVLTTDRLITRSGVFAKTSKEIPLERINDVAFHQTFVERILGAGDLLIESAGETGQNRIYNVRNPEQVQLAIYKESEKNQNRMYSGLGAGGREVQREPSIPEQIEALARLNKQGILSDLEFEEKKQELLKRI